MLSPLRAAFKPARHAEAQEKAIERNIEEKRAADVIIKSKGSWGSHTVPMLKTDGGEQMCIDYLHAECLPPPQNLKRCFAL